MFILMCGKDIVGKKDEKAREKCVWAQKKLEVWITRKEEESGVFYGRDGACGFISFFILRIVARAQAQITNSQEDFLSILLDVVHGL